MAQKRNSKELCDPADTPGSKPTATPSSISPTSPQTPQTVTSSSSVLSTQSTTITTASVAAKVTTPTNSKLDLATVPLAETSACIVSKNVTPSPMAEPVVVGEHASKGKV